MADELPPLESGFDEEIPSELLERNATWARKFGGSDTNLAQRRRHNQDITGYTRALQAEQEARQNQALQTNKTYQDLYFKSQELQRKRVNDEAALEDRDQRMRFARELHPLTLESRAAQTAADLARERAVINSDKLKAKLDQRKADDTTRFQDELGNAFDSGLEPGTPEAARAAARARLNSPFVDSALFDDMARMFGFSREEVEAEAARMKAAGQTGSVTSTGNISLSVKPEATPKTVSPGTIITRSNPDGTTTRTVTEKLVPIVPGASVRGPTGVEPPDGLSAPKAGAIQEEKSAPAQEPPKTNQLQDIVMAGGSVRKVGNEYRGFDKDGNHVGTFSMK